MNDKTYREQVKNDFESAIRKLIGVECRDLEFFKGKPRWIRLGFGNIQIRDIQGHAYALEVCRLWLLEKHDHQTGAYQIGSTSPYPDTIVKETLRNLIGQKVLSAALTQPLCSLSILFASGQRLRMLCSSTDENEMEYRFYDFLPAIKERKPFGYRIGGNGFVDYLPMYPEE